ncbi:MAG: methyltransferase domain-containing protein [Gammaproteobacteria bacterium]|nr:methyltransferase domain-containing protein [Gammaproteobacteria bacterium]
MLINNIGLIDLRQTSDFLKSHIRGSSSLPWERLPCSMHELPANHYPIALIGNSQLLQEAEAFLVVKGYEIIEQFHCDDLFWQQAAEEQIVEQGRLSVPLWRANPLLTEVISQVEKIVSGRIAVDLACGAGRDSVYLAQRGWQVTSIDNKTDTLKRCKQLARANQVDVDTKLIDLEAEEKPLNHLSADLVLIMRYLHRPLFSAIDELIKSKGAIIYSTFMVGSEKYGSPKNPNYLLKPGELAKIFASYEVVIDEQRELADGRPVAIFVAIKP